MVLISSALWLAVLGWLVWLTTFFITITPEGEGPILFVRWSAAVLAAAMSVTTFALIRLKMRNPDHGLLNNRGLNAIAVAG